MDQELDNGEIDSGVSHYIQLVVHLNGRLVIKSVDIEHNTTYLPSDSELVKKVSFGLLKAIIDNKESVMLQDLLNEIGISRE